MKKNAKKSPFLTAGFLLALLFATWAPYAHAATPLNEGITMSPVNKHYDLKAGEVADDTLLIINHGKTDYSFKLLAKGYDVGSETYMTLTDNIENPLADVSQWVSFPKTTYFLKAGENVTVPYAVRVPEKVTPGSHTGAIYAEIQPKETSGLIQKKSVGLVLYANVGGAYTQQGTVENVSIPFYQPNLPLRTSVRFLNTGTAYYEASVNATIYDLFGNKLAEQPKEVTVLPDRPRRVDVEQKNIGSVGLYKVAVTTKLLGSEKTTNGYVLVMPLWLLIGVPFLIMCGIIYVLFRPRKRQVDFRKQAR